jgi:hypothetical protein
MTTRSVRCFLTGILFFLTLLVIPALAPPSFASEDSRSSSTMTDLQKAEVLFNWLETQFPEVLPSNTTTQEIEGIIYRQYVTGVFLATYLGDLYFIGYDTFIPLGNVDALMSHVSNIPPHDDDLDPNSIAEVSRFFIMPPSPAGRKR